ncbi:DNA polymerase alpha catalytic subunit [Brevipalpus obovatus]|uniref:DNA polymerase alpha catalytic subunit n=1 Tax=Brevipalpus obovatus TaxID=246614 RepID=UPI003D9E1314
MDRVRRTNSSSSKNRHAAFENLKKTREGIRVDKILKEEKPIYDEIDEKDYAKLVEQRQNDNWIEDDDGEYVEDGREIFEDHDDDDELAGSYRAYGRGYKKSKKKISMKEKSSAEEEADDGYQRRNIKHYFKKGKCLLAPQPKRKDSAYDPDNDHILISLMADITGSSTPSTSASQSISFADLKKRVKKEPSDKFSRSYDGCSKSLLKPKPLKEEALFTPKRKFADISREEFDKVLNEEFLHELEQASKRVRKEPDDLLDPDYQGSDFTVPDAEPDEEDWSSGIERDQSSPLDTFSSQTLTEDDNGQDLLYTVDRDGKKYMKMYWIDAHEDPSKYPGRVYLFGKLRNCVGQADRYQSCCIIVENIERRIHLLPKRCNGEIKSTQDVYSELKQVVGRLKGEIKWRAKKVTKFYSFDHSDVPYEADYLEVLWPASRQFPDFKDSKNVAHVFGLTQTPLERIILDLKMKGPCWIKIREPRPAEVPVSWCKKEFIVYLEEDFSSAQFFIDNDDTIPPLTVCSINLAIKDGRIHALSCLTKNSYHIDSGKPTITVDNSNSFCFVKEVPPDFIRSLQSMKARPEFKFLNHLVKTFPNEPFMLKEFLVELFKIDPDVIVGHDLTFDINTILNRMSECNDAINWSRLGRLKRTCLKDLRSQKERLSATSGRIICDIKTMAKELCHFSNYELSELVKRVLKEEIQRKKNERADKSIILLGYLKSTKSRALIQMLQSLVDSNESIMDVMNELNVLALAMQITKIAGNLLSRTLMGGRAERNEFLLLHAFNEKNFILPDKVHRKFNELKGKESTKKDKDEEENDAKGDSKAKKKAAYSGGLVLEPKAGFYNSFILLMDFNSLYPSIIQEYNICFTTVSMDKGKMRQLDTGEEIPHEPEYDTKKELAILPTEIRKLVEGRGEVKRMMKNLKSGENNPEYKKLDIKQTALKLTANSMYGCLGFSNSRFYAKPLAALITYKGREILLKTKDTVEKMCYEVIYGDTDSIMINTRAQKFDEVKSIATKIQRAIEDTYRVLRMSDDGIYKPILLLKKKKYAAISLTKTNDPKGDKIFTGKVELKGLDIVRRDWSKIAKEEGEKVVRIILGWHGGKLTEKDVQDQIRTNDEIVEAIHSEMRSISEFVRKGDFSSESLNLFEISKQLTKNPEEYPDKKNLVHVNVAMRRNSDPQLQRKFKAGDVVPYIICLEKRDASKPEPDFNRLPSTQRAFHPDELLARREELDIDADYYLSQQIHPVVSRLCEPLGGTDAHILGEFLGIETNRIHRSSHDDDPLFFSKVSEYDSCKDLSFKCPNPVCRTLISTRQPLFTDLNTKKVTDLALSHCSTCGCNFSNPHYENWIVNSLTQQIRNICKNFMSNWMVCMADHRFRTLLSKLDRDKRTPGLRCLGPNCEINADQEITDSQIHKQLTFFESILDVDQSLSSNSSSEERDLIEMRYSPLRRLYSRLLEVIKKTKCTMSYVDIDLADIFGNQIFFCMK